MSYMRGDIYVWRTSDDLHIWVTAAFDDEMEEEEDRDGYRAAKIRIPQETFDELVVMRLAQLSPQEQERARTRAIEKWGENFGCTDLVNQYKQDETT
jgi:hypothetical protein